MQTTYKTTLLPTGRNTPACLRITALVAVCLFISWSAMLAQVRPGLSAVGGAQDFEGYIRPCPEELSLYLSVTDADVLSGEGGSVDASVIHGTPPYSFAWTGAGFSASTEDIDNLPAGEYTVVVTDARGCDVTGLVTVGSGEPAFGGSEDEGVAGFPRRAGEPGAAQAPEFSLAGVHPNPSDGHVSIRFTLQQAGDVVLHIVDQRGQLIRELVQRRLDEGEHQVSFAGSALASGVYFCKLQVAGHVLSQRFHVVR